jgi:hypothetical protein
MSNHEKDANSRTPALIIYLLDISGSMSESFEGARKIDYVNRALAGTLKRMIQRSTKGKVISPRYRLAMCAYSDQASDMLGGFRTIDEVATMGSPTLSPTNSTDTYAAFAWARDFLRRELPNLFGMPAPMVCHLTDGQFTGSDPEPLAQEIMQMANDDGNVLLENIYVGPDLTNGPIGDIQSWPGITEVAELRNAYAKKLFQMSSSLPETYASMIRDEGYGLRPGCRMLIPGSSSELIELAFTMSGATPVG